VPIVVGKAPKLLPETFVMGEISDICSNKYQHCGKTHVRPAINHRAKYTKPPEGDSNFGVREKY
jgi:hypothetical protein